MDLIVKRRRDNAIVDIYQIDNCTLDKLAITPDLIVLVVEENE